MEKNLTVYPISSGDVLNVFANDVFSSIRILDMGGNIVQQMNNAECAATQLDIKDLTDATYIVEIVYNDEKTARSVFVKTP